jgi:hypothetical protein
MLALVKEYIMETSDNTNLHDSDIHVSVSLWMDYGKERSYNFFCGPEAWNKYRILGYLEDMRKSIVASSHDRRGEIINVGAEVVIVWVKPVGYIERFCNWVGGLW